MPSITAGTGISSSTQLNAGVVDANAIATDAVDTAEIKSGAVTTDEIFDGTIINADISATAAIVDTKLAQITTANKVHGTSITGLASLPAGAGVIPAANISGNPQVMAFPGNGILQTATLSVANGKDQPCVNFADNTTGIWSTTFAVPPGCTSINKIEALYRCEDAGAVKVIWGSFTTSLYNYSQGGAIVTDVTDTDTSFNTVGTAGVVGILTAPADSFNAITGISYGDIFSVSFRRNSQNAADTYNLALDVRAIIVTFA